MTPGLRAGIGGCTNQLSRHVRRVSSRCLPAARATGGWGGGGGGLPLGAALHVPVTRRERARRLLACAMLTGLRRLPARPLLRGSRAGGEVPAMVVPLLAMVLGIGTCTFVIASHMVQVSQRCQPLLRVRRCACLAGALAGRRVRACAAARSR